MDPETYGWDWSQFRGSAEALKWNRRDLPCLDRVVAMCPERRLAVQAGGNLGIWPKRLASFFSCVLTFEPSPDLLSVIVSNAPESNVVLYPAALGEDHAGVGVSRVRRDGKPNHHEGITHVSGPGAIRSMRLDDLKLQVCDLVYLDIEGWELYALRGAQETIRRCRPVLAVEINKSLGFVGLTKEQVREFIHDLGYRFVERLRSDDVFVPVEWPA